MEHSIAWYARSPETPRQVEGLKSIFGEDTIVEHRGSPNNAQLLREDFEGSGAKDCVIVGPLAYLEHVLKEGIQPLWSQMEACRPDDPAVEIKLPDGRCFKFIEFRRLLNLHVKYAEILEALRHTRPAVVAWLSRHTPVQSSQEELKRLYGHDVRIRVDGVPFRNANEVLARTRNTHDVALVAPLSILDDLTKRGIQPIEPKLIGANRVELRRALGVEMEFGRAEPKS